MDRHRCFVRYPDRQSGQQQRVVQPRRLGDDKGLVSLHCLLVGPDPSTPQEAVRIERTRSVFQLLIHGSVFGVVREYRFQSGDGWFVVTIEGGRVAGLFAGDGLPNFLWDGTTGPVAGGDRMWLAPEVEIFYEDRNDRSTWRCPQELDPGTWTASIIDDGLVLNQVALGTGLRRVIRPLFAPPIATDLAWSGYVVSDTAQTEKPWSAWHLVMVPAPASVFVRGSNDPIVYYAPTPDFDNGWVPATGQAPEWKLGLHPSVDSRVVLAAIGETDPGPVVVVKSVASPSSTYIDVPPSGGPATALQVYNSPGKGFCELEHHAPLESRSYESTVFGAWGPLEQRLSIVERFASGPL